jgi:hypothetical protein
MIQKEVSHNTQSSYTLLLLNTKLRKLHTNVRFMENSINKVIFFTIFYRTLSHDDKFTLLLEIYIQNEFMKSFLNQFRIKLN